MDKLSLIINRWDPANLMTHAPDDEYELEIKMIKEILKKTENEHELAKGIQEVFLETVGETFFKKSFEQCFEISKEIIV